VVAPAIFFNGLFAPGAGSSELRNESRCSCLLLPVPPFELLAAFPVVLVAVNETIDVSATAAAAFAFLLVNCVCCCYFYCFCSNALAAGQTIAETRRANRIWELTARAFAEIGVPAHLCESREFCLGRVVEHCREVAV
jgi:hypothetical protein